MPIWWRCRWRSLPALAPWPSLSLTMLRASRLQDASSLKPKPALNRRVFASSPRRASYTPEALIRSVMYSMPLVIAVDSPSPPA
ncbi:hypothetical protein D9M68_477280 [compost metagenome]